MNRVPLVLLHPLGVDHSIFDDFRSFLEMPTWALDLPGHGAEPPLDDDAGLDEHVAWLTDSLDRAGLDQVDLLGVSLGGLYAVHAAATAAARVRSLVIVDTVVRYPEPMREMWHERARRTPELGTSAWVDPTLRLWFTESVIDAGTPIATTVSGLLGSTSPEGYSSACHLLAKADLTHQLAAVHQPSLVMCGRNDAPPFIDAVDTFVKTIPDARGAWLPGRHGALVESPEAAAAAVSHFLAPTPAKTTLEHR